MTETAFENRRKVLAWASQFSDVVVSDVVGVRYEAAECGDDFGTEHLVSFEPGAQRCCGLTVGFTSRKEYPYYFIQVLLALDKMYGDDLPYDLVPEFADGYNSNSYVSAILRGAGVMPPKLPVWVPGYRKPAPGVQY